MPFRFCRSLCVTLASFSLPGIALADTGYLSWQHKSDSQSPPSVSSGGQDYPVPPSPYGQVGDPFARTLTWSGKSRTPTQQQPQADPQPRPVAAAPAQALRQAPLRAAEPPRQQLANVEPLPVPQHPIPQVSAPVPVPQPRPVTVPEAMLRPALKPQPQAAAAQRPVPQPPVVAAVKLAPKQPAPSQAAPTQTASTGYRVPITSKYAARIASARAVAAKQDADATPAKPAAAKALDKKASETKTEAARATVPAPSSQLATEETDHVFIPGEQYKNASDAPRLYSLHRAYGLTPDPITVDHNATGAILDTADLDAKVDDSDNDKASDEDAKPAAGKSSSDSSARTADAAKADTGKVTQ